MSACRPLASFRNRSVVVLAIAVTSTVRPSVGDEPPAIPDAVGSTGVPRVDPVRPARLSAAERERLYGQVAREAEYLERQGAQLRRLTLLLRPTVVHIDARKPALRPRAGKASEEEAGSGVITSIAGRTVVITNRHVVNRAELDNITIRLDDGRELSRGVSGPMPEPTSRSSRSPAPSSRRRGWQRETRSRSATPCWRSAARSGCRTR